jgi:hypothetical protein
MNELYLKYYQNIYRNFHRAVADYLVIPNVDQMITTVYDPVWLDGDNNGETIDGAMIENFGGATGQDMYLTIDRCIRHITGRGKILIAQFNADTPEERFRRTAMYMLVKNENSFINIIPGEVGWYPEYEIDLGEQSKCPKTLQEIQFENSVWERKYSNGRIICNTSSESVLIEPLMWIPEAPGWEYIIKTSGGDEVSDDGIPMPDSIEYIAFTEPVDLLPSECLIIRIEGGTDVRELEEKDEIKLYPNPANDFLTVKFSLGAKPKEIKIFDMLGNCIKVIKVNPTNNAGIDVSDLKVGIYYIQIISSKQIFTNKFLKID